jgi:2-(1,2-epoxy-1,2-dihydrophenyl)acetyl-CoA isomerase
LPVSDEPLIFEVAGPIATLTLNRPQAGNTINLPLARSMLQAALRCDADPAIRCVVLTGRGKLFCGGGDLSSFVEAGDDVSAFLSELAGTLHMAVTRLMRMRKPLLVLVNGPAAGAGLSLAISGDVVVAAQSAHFTAAYGNVGLSPDGGMSWLLPRLVGMRRAQEMIILNKRVTAQEAEAIGLVTRAVADAELASAGASLATTLASSATLAIGAARGLLLESYDGALESQLEREARSVAASGATSESQEGVAAALARRKPDFQGG